MENYNFSKQAEKRVFITYRNIKKLRVQNGMSVKTLAKIMGVSKLKLILAEACINTEYLEVKHISRMCDYFNITLDDIASENFLK